MPCYFGTNAVLRMKLIYLQLCSQNTNVNIKGREIACISFWPTTEIQMGIEYTIKRKSFSQTYSTRHLTRLLCFFTTNLCVINKNKATKKKMYTIYLYFCWGLTRIHFCHNYDKTYISINLKTLNMSS